MLSDREITLVASKHVHSRSFIASFISKSPLKKDVEFCAEMIPFYLLHEWMNDRSYVLKAVAFDGKLLTRASETLKLDREVVLEALKQYTKRLKSTTHLTKYDKEWIFKIAGYFMFDKHNVLDSRDFILELLKFDSSVMLDQDFSSFFKNDREVALISVRTNGHTLKNFNFLNDREIVLEAIKQNGSSLQHAGWHLRKEFGSDQAVMLQAVNSNGLSLELASKELQSDKSLVLEAVKQNGLAIKFASLDLKYDKQVITTAVNQTKRAFHIFTREMRGEIQYERKYKEVIPLLPHGDKDFVLNAIKNNGMALNSNWARHS